jgi:metal-responsive CopG/Arc/MetJ family transcriptional regulator
MDKSTGAGAVLARRGTTIRISVVKTIAISIDDPTLRAIDRIAAGGRSRSAGAKARVSRSAIVRRALQEFVARQEKDQREAAERAVIARHADRLSREVAALVADQAEP